MMSEVNQETDFPQTGTLQMEVKISNSTPEVTSLEITQNSEVRQKRRTCCLSLQLPSNYIC
jgi:negative regulator of genetic competence, sporulation and motility